MDNYRVKINSSNNKDYVYYIERKPRQGGKKKEYSEELKQQIRDELAKGVGINKIEKNLHVGRRIILEIKNE